MPKGSATAIIAIVLILATVAAAGLYSSGKLTGAQTTVPSGSSTNWTLVSLIILIIAVAGMLFYLFYKSKSSTKKHSKKFSKRLVLPYAFAIIILILAGLTLIFGLPQLAKFAAPAPAEITTAPAPGVTGIEIVTKYPLNISSEGKSGWSICDKLEGGISAAQQFCSCKGYVGDASCYYDTNIRQRCSWTPGNPSNDCIYLMFCSTGIGTAVTKIQCLPEPPTITILQPENKTYSTQSNLPLNCYIATTSPSLAIDQCWYSLDNGPNIMLAGCSTAHTSFGVTSDGSHNIIVYANDTLGGVGHRIQYFSVDSSPPSVSITSPSSFSKISGVTNVVASASDNIAITKVEFYLDSETNARYTIAGSGPYSWPFNTATAVSGNHGIHVKAYDAAGNVGTSSTIAVNIQTSQCTGTHQDCSYVNPVPSSHCQVHGCTYDSSQQICTGKPSDCSLLNESVCNEGYGCKWTGPSPDKTPPTASAVSPTVANLKTNTVFSTTATDNIGVVSCDFWYDAQKRGTASQTGTTWKYTFSPQDAGTWKAQFKCYDAAGNEGLGTLTDIVVSGGAVTQCTGSHKGCDVFTTSAECSANGGHGGACSWLSVGNTGTCESLGGTVHTCSSLTETQCNSAVEITAGCSWPAPSCTGNVALSFSPNPVNVGSTTYPIASSLNNCAGKVVSFYSGTSCPSSGSPNVPITPFAVAGGGTGPNNCTIQTGATSCNGYAFTASTIGSYPYVACIDKNADGDYSDTGEQGSATLVVILPSPKPICRNNVKESGEDCDGPDLGGANCTNINKGYTGGNLACTSACKFDESGCIGPPVPPCNGTLALTFEPTTATVNHQVKAKVSGLANCDGNTATFDCTPGLSISSCTYSGDGCTSTFTPSKTGTYSCKANVSSTPVKSATQSLNVVACVMQNPVLTIEPPTFQKGARGDALLYMATVNNSNTCGSTFKLNVTTCLDKWSCDLSDTTLDLDEGESATAMLAITSPTSTDVGTRYYTHQLNASTVGNNAYNSTVDVNYQILKSCERKNPTLKVAKVSQSGLIGQERTYSIKITNLDLCSSYYTLDLGCEAGWDCSLDTPDIYLLDKENADFTATLMPDTGTTAGVHNFILTAVNSLDETKTANATLTYNVTGLNTNQSTNDQMWGKWKKDDGICDAKIGETISNSPADCAPPVEVTPVCGNNIVETGEDCDGSSDARCPSLCNADCTCPFIIGDGICDAAAGESSAISSDCAKKASSISLVILLVAILGAVGGVGYYFMKRRGMLGGLAAVHGVETATPGVDLGTAVNSMLSEGYNPNEIHSSLEAGGWSHGKIESAMASAQSDQEALGKLAERQGVAAPVEKAKASKYVKKCLAEGYDPTQIRTAMISSGWPADAVDGVISKQTAKHIQSHAEKAGVSEPSDDTHALNDYVKKEMNEGHTKQDITQVLKKAGWSDSDIKKAFGG